MAHRQFFNLYTSSQPQPGTPNGVPGWFMMPDANVGGPIVIPKIYNGRNKTFFFFGYEKLIEKKTQAYTSQTPTPDELNGDFTFGGLGEPLYDSYSTRQLADGSWTRDPFPSRGDSEIYVRRGNREDSLLQIFGIRRTCLTRSAASAR